MPQHSKSKKINSIVSLDGDYYKEKEPFSYILKNNNDSTEYTEYEVDLNTLDEITRDYLIGYKKIKQQRSKDISKFYGGPKIRYHWDKDYRNKVDRNLSLSSPSIYDKVEGQRTIELQTRNKQLQEGSAIESKGEIDDKEEWLLLEKGNLTIDNWLRIQD